MIRSDKNETKDNKTMGSWDFLFYICIPINKSSTMPKSATQYNHNFNRNVVMRYRNNHSNSL